MLVDPKVSLQNTEGRWASMNITLFLACSQAVLWPLLSTSEITELLSFFFPNVTQPELNANIREISALLELTQERNKQLERKCIFWADDNSFICAPPPYIIFQTFSLYAVYYLSYINHIFLPMPLLPTVPLTICSINLCHCCIMAGISAPTHPHNSCSSCIDSKIDTVLALP